jgi:hypothetical protein
MMCILKLIKYVGEPVWGLVGHNPHPATISWCHYHFEVCNLKTPSEDFLVYQVSLPYLSTFSEWPYDTQKQIGEWGKR